MQATDQPDDAAANTNTDTETDASSVTATDSGEPEYRVFHQKGRWQGLPLRVEDADGGPAFASVLPEGAPENAPDILMLGVPNQGMMSGQPTNVFLIGNVSDPARKLTLVDAGVRESWDALAHALDVVGVPLERIGQIVLTHCHPDHLGNAGQVQRGSGATCFVHPLEQHHIETWGDGVKVTTWLTGNERIEGDGFTLRTIFTPGHAPGHVCVVEEASGVLIAGDMISGFGSVGVFPPGGSMREYIESLHRLLAEYATSHFTVVCPGHGPAMPDARAKLEEYVVHRLQREEDVFAAVQAGGHSIATLMPTIYPDVQSHLSWPAERTLLAHLQKLAEDGRVAHPDEDTWLPLAS